MTNEQELREQIAEVIYKTWEDGGIGKYASANKILALVSAHYEKRIAQARADELREVGEWLEVVLKCEYTWKLAERLSKDSQTLKSGQMPEVKK